MTKPDGIPREVRPMRNLSESASHRFLEKLSGYVQYLYPTHLLSTCVFYLTRVRFRPFKELLIRWFVKRYGVDLHIAATSDLRAYENFNAFFTRTLVAGARPVAIGSIVSPADGVISQIGSVEDGCLIQAKGKTYTLCSLLGENLEHCRSLNDARFVTIYLSPKDYHRVHMPLAGRLREMSYLPGRLFSVSPVTTRVIPKLFARNERVVSLFESELGPMAIVMVGAMLVGSIETVWGGTLTPPHGRQKQDWQFGNSKHPPIELAQGEEMGRFNMGSTVILLLPKQHVRWRSKLNEGTQVKMGQALGEMV